MQRRAVELLPLRMAFTMRRAAKAMFITSFTTLLSHPTRAGTRFALISSCMSTMACSIVLRKAKRLISTSFVWPRRWMRPAACASSPPVPLWACCGRAVGTGQGNLGDGLPALSSCGGSACCASQDGAGRAGC